MLTDRSDNSAYGDHGAAVELPAWAADDEASVGHWRGGEEGMEARGLGNVRSAVVLRILPRC